MGFVGGLFPQELRRTWGCPGTEASSGGGEGLLLTWPTNQGVRMIDTHGAAPDVNYAVESKPQLSCR